MVRLLLLRHDHRHSESELPDRRCGRAAMDGHADRSWLRVARGVLFRGGRRGGIVDRQRIVPARVARGARAWGSQDQSAESVRGLGVAAPQRPCATIALAAQPGVSAGLSVVARLHHRARDLQYLDAGVSARLLRLQHESIGQHERDLSGCRRSLGPDHGLAQRPSRCQRTLAAIVRGACGHGSGASGADVPAFQHIRLAATLGRDRGHRLLPARALFLSGWCHRAGLRWQAGRRGLLRHHRWRRLSGGRVRRRQRRKDLGDVRLEGRIRGFGCSQRTGGARRRRSVCTWRQGCGRRAPGRMNTPATVTRVLSTPQSLTVEWANGEGGEFGSLWLRDNLPEDRDPHSGQRLLDIADVPEEPRIRSAVAEDGVVRVEWESETRPASFEFDWLARHAAGSTAHRPELTSTLWLEGAVLDAERDFAHAPLSALRGNPSTRLAWLTRLLQQGIAFLTGVPSNKSAILEAMSLVGRVVETHYGLVFDVQSAPEPENLAYSDRGLGLHTDNPYREPVPGFQALHALVASREGGDSLFADGFALAEHLRANDAGAFRQLTHNLNDGDLVVFDNQRILHGRTGFSSAQYPRHLRGCYLTRDSVYGETALLRRRIEREARL